jgi:hypothetical protein
MRIEHDVLDASRYGEFLCERAEIDRVTQQPAEDAAAPRFGRGSRPGTELTTRIRRVNLVEVGAQVGASRTKPSCSSNLQQVAGFELA